MYKMCIRHIFRTWGWKCNCRQYMYGWNRT